MKKIIATLLACTLLLSCNVVWAASTPSLSFLKTNTAVGGTEQSGTVSFKLHKPLEILELLAEDEDSGVMSNYVDIVMLLDSLFDSTMTVRAKTSITNGGKKQLTEAHIKSDIPFKANANLEGDIKTNQSVWTELDFTDAENPYFGMIMAHPFAAKYITLDSDLLLENDEMTAEELVGLCSMLFDSENLVKINDKMLASMEKHATITGNSRKVKITFTDIGLKMYLADIIVSVLGAMDAAILESYDEDAVKEALQTVPVFGKEALVTEYTLDAKSRIIGEKTTLNVDLNVYDLITALDGEEPLAESGITKENSAISFAIAEQSTYQYGSVEIQKPVLTEENSIDIFEYEDPYYYDEPEYDMYEEYYDPWAYANIDANCYEGGEVKYVRLRSFLESAGYFVSYDNGTIRAQVDSEHAKYKAFCFVIGADCAYTDLHDVNMKTPLFLKDGVTYISIDDCENLTNYVKDGLYYSFETKGGYIDFVDYEYMYGEAYEQ